MWRALSFRPTNDEEYLVQVYQEQQQKRLASFYNSQIINNLCLGIIIVIFLVSTRHPAFVMLLRAELLYLPCCAMCSVLAKKPNGIYKSIMLYSSVILLLAILVSFYFSGMITSCLLGVILPFTIGLSYLHRRGVWIVTAMSLFATVVIIVLYVFRITYYVVPENSYINIINYIFSATIIASIFLVLHHVRERLVETLLGLHQANIALSTAKEDLESQVAARTAELSQALKQAEVAHKSAAEANELKSHFLASMSHELRTPLNAIINFTHFAADPDYGAISEDQQQFLGRVISNSEHLLGLINDILDLSKIEAGKMDLYIEESDLGALIHGVMSTAVGITADKQLELQLHSPQMLPPVWMDKQRIRQVLLNLISNAVKFTKEGQIIIHVKETNDGFISIAVQDTGIGIPPEKQEYIFEEFIQVDQEHGEQYQGTGLGLPISKKFVLLHGGTMSVESIPGQGSTFTFTLPLQQPASQPAGLHEAAPASPSSLRDDQSTELVVGRK